MSNDYDIFDLETGNLVASLPDEAAALSRVRGVIEKDGRESIEARALGRADHKARAIYGRTLCYYASEALPE